MSTSSSHPFPFRRTPARCLLQFLPPVSRQRECRGLQGGMVLPSGLALVSALCAACLPHAALVLEKLNSSSQRTLHLVVILVLVLSLCSLLLSSGLTFYNSISNPYQTFLGPVGVYTGSGLGGEYPPGTPLLTGTASGSLSLCCSVPHGNAHDPGGAMDGDYADLVLAKLCARARDLCLQTNSIYEASWRSNGFNCPGGEAGSDMRTGC